jgi:lysophospholipase L1-like esterase
MKFLVLLLFLVPLSAQAEQNLATAPISRANLPWWKLRFQDTLADARAHPNAKLVWLGDSIIQYWQRQGTQGYDNILPVWQHYYGPYQAVDCGVKGDTTASLIWRLDHGQVTGLHPRLAIILIGANNFGRVHWDAKMTIPGIEAVVDDTHKHLPGAHILLLGVLPSVRSAWVDEQTAITNAALARHYAGSTLVTFVDVGPLFMKNGAVDQNLFVDPRMAPPEPALHPDAQGMRLIAERIAPLVDVYTK